MERAILRKDVKKIIEIARRTPSELNKKNEGGRNPLMQAFHYNDFFIMEVLYLLGARGINDLDVNGFTVLHYHAPTGHVKSLDIFVSLGADIDALSADKYTAMHIAAMHRNGYLVRALYDLGSAALTMRTQEGETPYELALSQKHTGLAHYIASQLETGVRIPDPSRRFTSMYLYAVSGETPKIETLVELKAQTREIVDRKKGRSPLYQGAKKNSARLVQLLHTRAVLDRPSDSSRTPLHAAVSHHALRSALELHRLGSEAHFMADSRKRAPARVEYVRRLYFSRSLAETLFFSSLETRRSWTFRAISDNS